MNSTFLLRTAVLAAMFVGCANGTSRHAEARKAPGVVSVGAGGDLQAALNNARPGDTIQLAAGSRYVGSFELPPKDGNDWITIQTAPSLARPLPPAGTRVGPDDAVVMAKIVAPSGSALSADPGAHHYRFVGVEVAPAPGVFVLNLIDLGSPRTLDAVAHDITFDRCYIHGDPAKGGRRGIALNSGETTVRESYMSDFKEVGADSQAIAGWDGPGPFHILNNYLEGAGENILFGGADPAIANLVPSDIEILRNTLSKPLSWRVGDPQYSGTHWSVKNLLELKNAQRVRIEANTLQYNWSDAQNGFSILFTVRNQDGHSPWSTVQDVTFVNNIVRHVAAGVNILGHDDINQSQPAQRIVVRNNLFEDVSQSFGNGKLFQILNGAANVTIDHNTAFQTDSIVLADEAPDPGFVFQNNIAPHNQYGILGSGAGVGKPSLDQYFPGAVVRRNVIIGGNASVYPSDNFFPASIGDVKFTDIAHENFRLLPSSPYRGQGTDGHDVGADFDAIQSAMAGRIPGYSNGHTEMGAMLTLPTVELAASPAVLLFFASLALLAYAYVGYAGLIWTAARVHPRPLTRRDIEPHVTVLVVAYNEEARIERRIANLLEQEYRQDRLDIVIASDGSSDGTVERAMRFGDRVRVISFPIRRGKPAVMNDVIPQLRSEVVVLADARQQFNPAAVAALVRSLSDPAVGAVSGELILLKPDASPAAHGAAIYWNYEKLIRWSESQVDSTIGATGAIYAIRRSLFEPIPPDTILDDVLIPLRIARQGYRVVFEPDAKAFDRALSAASDEFVRKVRTMAGNVQLFARERWLFRPRENRLWFQAISHKAARLALPALYAMAFLANLALLRSGALYQAAFACQVLFYTAAAAACVAPRLRRAVPLLVIPYEICFLNWAAVVGIMRYLTNRQRVTWDRPRALTARQ